MFAPALRAQEDFERFRVEVSGSAWLIDTSGTIQSGITPVDLQRDLGIDQRQATFFGKLVVKPARRFRLSIEGVPYRLSGQATFTRAITYGGRTFDVQDLVTSNASIGYIAGAGQFDFVSRPRGHLGGLAGIAYIDAAGTLTARSSGFGGTEQQSFPFPVLGMEGRLFVLPHRNLLEVDGELKGMTLGSYGHFLQLVVQGGISFGRHLTLQAGYLLTNADVHRRDNSAGFHPTFEGPVFGIQMRDR